MIGGMVTSDKTGKLTEVIKEAGEKEGFEGDVEFSESEDDLLSSQELDVLVKDMGVDVTNSQDDMISEKDDPEKHDMNIDERNKKNKGKGADPLEGIRKSTRLEANEDIKITDKAISRAVAKDAFLNKGMSSNPFSVLSTSDNILVEMADLLNVSLGKNAEEVCLNMVYNKKEDLRRERKYSLRNKKKNNSPKVRCTPNKRRVKKRETPELLVP
jgi:hypothetical protein